MAWWQVIFWAFIAFCGVGYVLGMIYIAGFAIGEFREWRMERRKERTNRLQDKDDGDYHAETQLLRQLPDGDVAWLAKHGWIQAKSEKLTRESDY